MEEEYRDSTGLVVQGARNPRRNNGGRAGERVIYYCLMSAKHLPSHRKPCQALDQRAIVVGNRVRKAGKKAITIF